MAAARLLVAFLLLSLATSANAGEYADPSGFSFAYPDDWVLITSAQLADPQLPIPPETRAWLDQHKIDLTQIAVAVIRPGPDDSAAAVNVIVHDRQVPATDSAAQALAGQFVKVLEGKGITVHNFRVRVERVGGRDALVCDAVTTTPGDPERLHQRQVLFPGGGRTFGVTCTATVESFERHRPGFETILNSFQAPAPKAGGIDFGNFATRVALGGMAGALGGAVFGVFRRLFGRRPEPTGD